MDILIIFTCVRLLAPVVFYLSPLKQKLKDISNCHRVIFIDLQKCYFNKVTHSSNLRNWTQRPFRYVASTDVTTGNISVVG
jgi:hypothetical protein